MKIKINLEFLEDIDKNSCIISNLSYKNNVIFILNKYAFNINDKTVKNLFSSYDGERSRNYENFLNRDYFVFSYPYASYEKKYFLDIVDLESLIVYKVFIENLSEKFYEPSVYMFKIKEGLLINFYIEPGVKRNIILDLESKTIKKEISLKFDYLICVHPNEDILLGWEEIFKSEQYKLKYYSLSEDIQGYLEFPYKSFSSNGSFSNSGKYLAIEIPESAVKLDYLDKINQRFCPILRMYDFDSKNFLYEIGLEVSTFTVLNRDYEVYDIFFSKNDEYLILVLHDGQFGRFVVWVISIKDGNLLAMTGVVLSAKYDVESDVLAYILDSDGEKDTIIIELIDEVIKNNPKYPYMKDFYMTGFKEWYR
jgi:hypothetical protein